MYQLCIECQSCAFVLCSVSVCLGHFALLHGFKKGPTGITTFPDVVLLHLPLPRRYHLCAIVQGIYNTQLMLQIMVVKKKILVCLHALYVNCNVEASVSFSMYLTVEKGQNIVPDVNLMLWFTGLHWSLQACTFFIQIFLHVSSTYLRQLLGAVSGQGLSASVSSSSIELLIIDIIVHSCFQITTKSSAQRAPVDDSGAIPSSV